MDPMLWWRSYQNSWEMVENKNGQWDATISTNVMLGIICSGLSAEETTEEIASDECLLEEEDNLRNKYSEAPHKLYCFIVGLPASDHGIGLLLLLLVVTSSKITKFLLLLVGTMDILL